MLEAGKPRSAARYLAQLTDEARKDVVIADRLAADTLALERSLPDLTAQTDKMFEDGKVAEAVLALAGRLR